jgi:hypothetical protein
MKARVVQGALEEAARLERFGPMIRLEQRPLDEVRVSEDMGGPGAAEVVHRQATGLAILHSLEVGHAGLVEALESLAGDAGVCDGGIVAPEEQMFLSESIVAQGYRSIDE